MGRERRESLVVQAKLRLTFTYGSPITTKMEMYVMATKKLNEPDPLTVRVVAGFKDAEFLVEAMANLRSRTTGIDGAVIWVSAGEFTGADAQHGPRIKVVLGDKITTDGLKDAVSVRLTNPPEVLGDLPSKIKKKVVQFVNRNRDVLLRHWNGEIDSIEMGSLLRRV